MARVHLAVAGLIFVAHAGYAYAENPVQVYTQSTGTGKWKKLAGSTVELSTYIGSGSLYASGYSDPYASLALYLKPTYDLGTRFNLSLRARIYFEEELTLPDNPTGRRFNPYDPWLWLSGDLHTFERSKIKIGGTFRTVLPLAYESRYRHDIITLAAGGNVNRDFEFGAVNDEKRKWSLKLTYAFLFYKPFQSSHFRGSGPGDTTGCLAPSGAGAAGATSGGPSGASGDHCGGPANTNYSIGNAFFAWLGRDKWSLTVSLQIFNDFKYAFPADALTADNAAVSGRADTTWGVVALGYKLTDRVSLGAGISTLQPALDSRYQYPRFPFWDFSGGTMNNYSQVFFSVGGTL
jgi:hypothetical protein